MKQARIDCVVAAGPATGDLDLASVRIRIGDCGFGEVVVNRHVFAFDRHLRSDVIAHDHALRRLFVLGGMDHQPRREFIGLHSDHCVVGDQRIFHAVQRNPVPGIGDDEIVGDRQAIPFAVEDRNPLKVVVWIRIEIHDPVRVYDHAAVGGSVDGPSLDAVGVHGLPRRVTAILDSIAPNDEIACRDVDAVIAHVLDSIVLDQRLVA